MKQQGLEKAMFRLRNAQDALVKAENSPNSAEFHRYWSEFLSSVDGIYNCLAQSIGGDVKSRKWFDVIVGLRKNDPLLRYFKHARNVDNHGIEPPAHYDSGQVKIGGRAEEGFSRKIEVRFDTGPGGFFETKSLDGKPVAVEKFGPRLKLNPVKDRGVIYDPPKDHLGRQLVDQSAIGAGRALLKFLNNALNEARGLIC